MLKQKVIQAAFGTEIHKSLFNFITDVLIMFHGYFGILASMYLSFHLCEYLPEEDQCCYY